MDRAAQWLRSNCGELAVSCVSVKDIGSADDDKKEDVYGLYEVSDGRLARR